MKFKIWSLVLLICGLNVISRPTIAADDIIDLMKQSGVIYTELQKAVLVNADLSDGTLIKAQELADLFFRSVATEPDFGQISKDPLEQRKLLFIFRKIMAETLAVNYEVIKNIFEQNLELSKESMKKLNEKRKEGHLIFRQ